MWAQFFFSTSASPHLFFLFFHFNKNTISFSCCGWEKCDALPIVCSVIASEPHRCPEPLLTIILASGKLCVSVCANVCVLQLQTNGVFHSLFVLKQRGAYACAPLCHTHLTHRLLFCVWECVKCVCVCVFDSCVPVEDSSLRCIENTIVGCGLEAALQTTTAFLKSKEMRERERDRVCMLDR